MSLSDFRRAFLFSVSDGALAEGPALDEVLKRAIAAIPLDERVP
ncbi:hypothetical protein [Mucilaginibacter xinganensis]|uniref:Uncharacterized protein n=1 Tax=Mucilaginibacter xinganensis TaxID=1234841 RepID=A0A223P1S9_9SPHI|nr:hypothetical protein [Mucilaginibacter xinganensis]ASU35894.1 hypothetical protein MuYL_4009 [Mucilaginibacter xinganensis]